MITKRLTVAMAVTFYLCLPAIGAVAATFPDVRGHHFERAIEFIRERGIVQGYPDGTFGPDQSIVRAELVKIIVEATSGTPDNEFSGRCFPDIDPSEWYSSYVCFAAEHELVQGYPDGTFHPEREVNFVEALKIVSRAFSLEASEQKYQEWFRDYVEQASTLNLIPLDINAFNQKLTRGSMADMIARFIHTQEGSLDEYLGGFAGPRVTYDSIQRGDHLLQQVIEPEMGFDFDTIRHSTQEQLEEFLQRSEVQNPDMQFNTSDIDIAEELIPPELAELFDFFDRDGDGTINHLEGELFYYWVEENIEYRYDDEFEQAAEPGSLIGDGREGPDYRQTPYETVMEGAGDCEDTATLEAAFYNYWGITAYVGGVNAKEPGVLDHAVAIVRISGTPEEFAELLGDLTYWVFKMGDSIYAYNIEEFPAGTYMLVDNAYSAEFGSLSEGLTEGTFDIYCLAPIDGPYDGEWNSFIEECGYEWTT